MATKYYVTNGDKVIAYNNSSVSGAKYKPVIGSADVAVRFKYTDGLKFISTFLHSDMEWGVQKLFSAASKKNYVITTATNFVGDNGTITNMFSNAKAFRSVADAEAYIKNHREVVKSFGNAYIVTDKLEKYEMSERKTFTDEQLKVLGITNKKSAARKIFSKNARINLYESANHNCRICGKPLAYNEMTIDHIVPLSRGGKNTYDNLRCVCEDCNKIKGNRLDDEMYKGLINICSAKVAENPDDEMWNNFIRAKVRATINKYNLQNKAG